MARTRADDGVERAEVSAVAALGRTRVVVIGGGINGIGTLRDLALQGVDAVLVERADFASGATAASSHMIHGGIRYLENGEFRLVRESVRERNDLLRTAPHFVRPLQTTIPIYSTFSGILAAPARFLSHRARRPRERGAVLIKTGLVLYDLFSRGGREVPRHRFAGRARTRTELPRLDPRVKYSATYYDAGVRDPERLAVDILLDAVAAHDGIHALNYVEAVGLGPTGVRLRDVETGREFELAADIVVNATGPWVDLTNAALGQPTRWLGGTKGSHIVLDHPELLAATGGREIFFEHDDGRIVLIYPLRDRVLVGTTDIPADLAVPAVCTDEEVEYFFALVRHVFPDIAVRHDDIVYRYAGIRPLPRQGDLAPGFVSRDYRTERQAPVGGPVVFGLVGGKWTTFRAVAESLADRVLTELGMPRRVGTAGVAIGGGRDYPRTPAARAAWLSAHLKSVPVERRDALLERYGTRACDVAGFLGSGRGGADRLVAAGLSEREIAYLAVVERVAHLTDLVFRRTDLAMTGRADAATVEALGAALGRALGWSTARAAREIDACRQALAGPVHVCANTSGNRPDSEPSSLH